MICKFCGEQLPDNARFCGSCGSKLEPEATPEQDINGVVSNDSTEPENNDAPAPQEDSGNAKIPLTIGSTPAANTSTGGKESIVDKIKSLPKPLIAGLAVGLVVIIVVVAVVAVSSGSNQSVLDNNDNYEEDYIDNEDLPVNVENGEFSVYFEPNNGEPVSEVKTLPGLIQEPAAPVREGFVFDGWYDASLQNKWDFAVNEASGTMRLYAKWTEAVTKYAENEKLVIAGDGLRLRATPDLAGQKIGLIPNGTRITVLDTVDGWSYTTYKGISGWCSSDFLYNPADYEGQVLFKATVDNRNGIALYVNEDVNSTVINSYIGYKSTVYVYEVDDLWSYVRYGDQFGWCLSEYLDDF